MARYPDIKAGQWVEVSPKYKICCCDCGLVHDLEFRIINGEVQMRAFRDNRSSSALRRYRNFKFNNK